MLSPARRGSSSAPLLPRDVHDAFCDAVGVVAEAICSRSAISAVRTCASVASGCVARYNAAAQRRAGRRAGARIGTMKPARDREAIQAPGAERSTVDP